MVGCGLAAKCTSGKVKLARASPPPPFLSSALDEWECCNMIAACNRNQPGSWIRKIRFHVRSGSDVVMILAMHVTAWPPDA